MPSPASRGASASVTSGSVSTSESAFLGAAWLRRQGLSTKDKDAKGLPGIVKVGGWHHGGVFDDPRFASNGLSQAAPGASPEPAQVRSNYAVYSVVEQMKRALQVLALSPRPVRSLEALLTLSYLAEVRSGWTVLPTFQYIIHPGGGYVLDDGKPKAVRNAAVLGVRAILKF